MLDLVWNLNTTTTTWNHTMALNLQYKVRNFPGGGGNFFGDFYSGEFPVSLREILIYSFEIDFFFVILVKAEIS